MPVTIALASIFALTLTQEPAAASASVGVSTDSGASADASGRAPARRPGADAKGTPWMRRHEPQRGMMELGVFGGVLLPSQQHELYDPTNAYQRYRRAAPDLGIRFAYFPLRFFGLEVEGAVMPTRTESDDRATLFGLRGHAVLQLPRRITPFALAGIGAFGASSAALGRDVDPSLHFGGGVKFFINDLLALRLDLRDNISAAHQIENGRTNHVEVLLGLSLALGRKKTPASKLIDSDGDGLWDPGQGVPKQDEDRCPNEPGPRSNQGCPLVDSDGDGLWDPGQGAPAAEEDRCPMAAGPRSTQGCPLVDSDLDGFFDPGQGAPVEQEDRCPSEPGPKETRGCPIKDSDGDGLADPGQGVTPEDQCPREPESFNNYQDADGCPDTIPKEVAKFTGAIRGINFDVNKDTIKPNSKKTLDAAVKVLKDFGDVRIEISGHTDSDGSAEYNRDLSRRRAESVKRYLVDAGIAADRIETRGAGPDEPVADNNSKRGKAQNRRIEFKLLAGKMEGNR
ncbi:MAG TPA: OmpA family protein [Nannocystaceae bacterium]|nr:OmpA family protein [Nannocystaceae bacterium]